MNSLNAGFIPLSEKVHFSYIYPASSHKSQPFEKKEIDTSLPPPVDEHLRQTSLIVKGASLSLIKENKSSGSSSLLIVQGRLSALKNLNSDKTTLKGKIAELAIKARDFGNRKILREGELKKNAEILRQSQQNMLGGFQNYYAKIKAKKRRI